jgi:hypothetical protein
MLHLILGRLGSARDAVRTTALSRRWRGLFPRREIVFRDVAFSSLEAELGSICLCHPCTKVYRIKTCVHGGCIPDEHAVQSLINAANRLTPQQYSLVLPSSGICKGANLLDGCFHNQQPGFIRATCYVYLRSGEYACSASIYRVVYALR